MGAEGGEAKTDEDGLVDVVEFVERCLREDLEKIFGSTMFPCFFQCPFPAFSPWVFWHA